MTTPIDTELRDLLRRIDAEDGRILDAPPEEWRRRREAEEADLAAMLRRIAAEDAALPEMLRRLDADQLGAR